MDIRTLDGSGNNEDQPDWGRAGTPLLRTAPPGAGGTRRRLGAAQRPNARAISNAVCNDAGATDDPDGRTHWMWAWGQFLDHEIDLTPDNNREPVPIVVPDDESEAAHRGYRMPFNRSKVSVGTGVEWDRTRQQVNALSAFVDAANVYGPNAERLKELRRSSQGLLETQPGAHGGQILPFNRARFPIAAPPGADVTGLYLAGDERANEHVVLTSLHTLFVRIHNARCAKLAGENRSLDDEDLFQGARKWVGAHMQAITYNEFLPELLGPESVQGENGYRDYDPGLQPGIANEFSTAAYRIGHSMLPDSIPVQENGAATRIDLQDAFFDPELIHRKDIGEWLGLLHTEPMRRIDTRITDAVRNNLFRTGPSGHGHLLDLASLNIQRGRDHCLASYNDCREAYGLERVATFAHMVTEQETRSRLQSVYKSPDDVDLWIGCLAETPVCGAVGPLMYEILHEQFLRLRDADRFWFENDPFFDDDDCEEINSTTLADLLRVNAGVAGLPDNLFNTGGESKWSPSGSVRK